MNNIFDKLFCGGQNRFNTVAVTNRNQKLSVLNFNSTSNSIKKKSCIPPPSSSPSAPQAPRLPLQSHVFQFDFEINPPTLCTYTTDSNKNQTNSQLKKHRRTAYSPHRPIPQDWPASPSIIGSVQGDIYTEREHPLWHAHRSCSRSGPTGSRGSLGCSEKVHTYSPGTINMCKISNEKPHLLIIVGGQHDLLSVEQIANKSSRKF